MLEDFQVRANRALGDMQNRFNQNVNQLRQQVNMMKRNPQVTNAFSNLVNRIRKQQDFRHSLSLFLHKVKRTINEGFLPLIVR